MGLWAVEDLVTISCDAFLQRTIYCMVEGGALCGSTRRLNSGVKFGYRQLPNEPKNPVYRSL
jgi:hypothetical protein